MSTRTMTSLLVIVAALLGVSRAATQAPSTTVAFTNVNVLPMDANRVLRDHTAAAKQYIDNRMRIMTALYKGGVSILMGSDAPQQFNAPGFSMQHEMRRTEDAGMSRYDDGAPHVAAMCECSRRT